MVVDEECNGAGAGTLACCLAGITADFCICLDGSTEAIHNGFNGITTPRITVYGRAGHAAIGGAAVNAIDKAFLVKQAIDGFAKQHLAKHADCRVNLGIFRSGTLPAIVPPEAELQLNISCSVEDARAAEQTNGAWNGSVVHQRVETMLAWFDAAHLARVLKKPVLGIGSGTPGQAHGAAETAQLDDLYRGARCIALSLYRLLA